MSLKYYVLDDEGEPVACDWRTWGLWFETHFFDRCVLRDDVGRVRVSTVFLGLDHRHFGDGPPILWETMVFGGLCDGFQRRATSKLDALLVHQHAVALVEWTRRIPRRLKVAARKSFAYEPLRPVERHRFERALQRVA